MAVVPESVVEFSELVKAAPANAYNRLSLILRFSRIYESFFLIFFSIVGPIKLKTSMTSLPAGISRENLPLMSVTVPLVVPISTTLVPGSGSIPSTTFPEIVRVWARSPIGKRSKRNILIWNLTF